MILKVDTEDFKKYGINGATILACIKAVPDSTSKDLSYYLSISTTRAVFWLHRFEDEGLLKIKYEDPNKKRSLIVGVEFL